MSEAVTMRVDHKGSLNGKSYYSHARTQAWQQAEPSRVRGQLGPPLPSWPSGLGWGSPSRAGRWLGLGMPRLGLARKPQFCSCRRNCHDLCANYILIKWNFVPVMGYEGRSRSSWRSGKSLSLHTDTADTHFGGHTAWASTPLWRTPGYALGRTNPTPDVNSTRFSRLRVGLWHAND